MNKLRLFIIECSNPIELLEGVSESQCLEKVCKLAGHDVATFQVLSKEQLKTVCDYISTISIRNRKNGLLLCVHLSAHGNENGLTFGKDFVEWNSLFEVIQPICRITEGCDKIVFVISACGAGKQKLTQKIGMECKEDNQVVPPKYLFVIMDEIISWQNAVVLWTVFYHQLSGVSLDDTSKGKIQNILDKIKRLGVGGIQYHRWDDNEKRYLDYKPGKKLRHRVISKRGLRSRRRK